MEFQFTELLQSVAIISGISTFLAVLVVIADATIGNYGKKKIFINEDKELEVEGGQSLLNSLKSEGIFIPSACGGRGSCGLCKVKVNSGAGEYLPTELPFITDDEQKNNIRLSCQGKVKNEIHMEIPEELFNIKEYQAKVSKIVDLTHDIKGITFDLGDEEISFKPGQYVQIEVPEYELSDEPVYRAYSVASSPSQNRSLELQIKYVPHGLCTTYVHKHLKESQNLNITGPYGDFFLQDNDREMVCMAVGSGMAPIKSILLYMAENNISRKVKYFYGARTRADLFDIEIMEDLEKKMDNFTFIPVLSRPTSDCNWSGETGRINTLLNKFYENGDNKEAYLCGAPQALDAFKEALMQIGISEELIYYDAF